MKKGILLEIFFIREKKYKVNTEYIVMRINLQFDWMYPLPTDDTEILSKFLIRKDEVSKSIRYIINILLRYKNDLTSIIEKKINRIVINSFDNL